jgi:hypothetical protein
MNKATNQRLAWTCGALCVGGAIASVIGVVLSWRAWTGYPFSYPYGARVMSGAYVIVGVLTVLASARLFLRARERREE